MLASLSQNTLKQYNVTFKKWWCFCESNVEQVLNPTTEKIMCFLNEEYKKGGQYASLNTHRSALNLISDAGKSELVERFMRGVFKLRPQFPKYEETWDPEPVLKYVGSIYPLENRPLEEVTLKMVLLLALCTAHRVQTFSKIKISNIKIYKEGIEIGFPDIVLKTSGPKKAQPKFMFPFFHENPQYCISLTITKYLDITKKLRGTEDTLILTTKKPHKPATSQTISRWIKKGLHNSGIDEKFKGHSTRHAASSAALRAGVSIENIRKAASWSEKSKTFNTFYNRPLRAHDFFSNYIKKLLP